MTTTPSASSENSYHRLSQEGIDLAYNLHLDAATAIFDQLIQLEPDNPHGYLLQSVNLYYRYQLEENPEELGKQFQTVVSEAIDRAEKNLHDKSQSLDMLFYLGTANIYLAAYHGWERNWLRAYIYGKEGIDYLKKLIAIDPNYYDAYLGLGLYHYYTDVIPKFARPVTFILGIESDKMKGLAELALAAEKGTYSRAEALLFLGSIYLYLEKDYNKSLACLENLNRLYPENASFLMLLGENYQKVGDHERAITTLNYLVNEATNLKFPILMIGSYFRLGNLYFNLKNFPEAIEQYRKSLYLASASKGNVRWVFALANLNLGRAFDLMDQRQRALEHYKLVKKSDHKFAYKNAQERLKTPLVSSSNSAPDTKNFDEILEIYQLATATNGTNGESRPNMLELHFYIAKAFYDQGAHEKAIDKFSKIIRVNDDGQNWIKPWSYFYLGNAYIAIGNLQMAQKAYQIAYSFDDYELRAKIEAKRREITELE